MVTRWLVAVELVVIVAPVTILYPFLLPFAWSVPIFGIPILFGVIYLMCGVGLLSSWAVATSLYNGRPWPGHAPDLPWYGLIVGANGAVLLIVFGWHFMVPVAIGFPSLAVVGHWFALRFYRHQKAGGHEDAVTVESPG